MKEKRNPVDVICGRICADAFAYEMRVVDLIHRWRRADRACPFVDRAPPPPEKQRARDLTGIGAAGVDAYIAQLPQMKQRRKPSDRLSPEDVADLAAYDRRKPRPDLTARPTNPGKRRGAP